MAIIDSKNKGAFVDACPQLIQNIQSSWPSDCMLSEALSGTSAQPTLVSVQRVERKNENALVRSVSAVNQDNTKPVVGS
jgi:hypothetical protein